MPKLLLSFDIEEFDLPLENGVDIPFEEQMRRSVEGAEKILEILKRNKVVATLFCTANFAENAPDIIKRAVNEGHEIASHGLRHSQFYNADLLRSKEILEEITQVTVRGFRMARMMSV
ncbi:MAG: polysaccharide deacetylase family protein, partial [Bacteroidales bacterium]